MRLVLFITLAWMLFTQQAGCQTKRKVMSKSAQDYIAAFERNEDFQPPAKGVYVNGQPDESAIQTLAAALQTANPNVRENIVHLLVEMGRSSDPLTPKGADVLRHKQIIDVLVKGGLVKPDLGREAAMDALRKLCRQPDLAQYDSEFTNALADEPTAEAFLLVAKAKAYKAKELIERLIKLPKWQNLEEAKIARAALGSTADEDEFLAKAAESRTGEALAAALGPLALMGTPKSIKTIASYLRSPLTIEIPGHMPGRNEKTVRLNVLEALLYNFPDEPVLYPNNIHRDEDYRAAERFCTDRLGVVYREPPPPFMKYLSSPVPMG